MTRIPAQRAALGLAALATIAAGIGTGGAAAAPSAGAAASRNLVGTFKITAGRYAKGKAGGSFLRMILPGGGKYFDNPDSRSPDKSYTLIGPGGQGGLATGRYQPNPSPVFDSKGDARVNAIMSPQSFDGIKFSVASVAKNPKTGAKNPAPSIRLTGTTLSGQVEAVTAEWNGQYFAQGSTHVTGRYNPKTRAFLLTWSSPISGGPFNGFTGSWHLQGTFVPS
ncbi:MAG TPA: hypothetical protein VHW26_02185 [Solirubrobacteraceae bacterium]|jgi:hypothetical protein|nr:hypothetical protein [Solirubrobacteraceae bacterium]